jgi:1-hydroxycarotenoid 3,4-desaturase
MRQLSSGGQAIDAGPTVFTMRWVFEQLFASSGARFHERVNAEPATVLARHAWIDRGQLDLHADLADSAKAIGTLAGESNARGFHAFAQHAANNYRVLRDSFMANQQPHMLSLAHRVGLTQIPKLLATQPHKTLNKQLKRYFSDPRLVQLFGRYATYVGSSPYQCPATLMLIAHVEQDGVWQLPGGMRSLAKAMSDLSAAHGAQHLYRQRVTNLSRSKNRTWLARLDDGEELEANAVVYAGDCNALTTGALGEQAALAVAPRPAHRRGLSAITWCVVAKTSGFELDYHNVFFADQYQREFQAIFNEQMLPEQPTVYVCAQDRLSGQRPKNSERLLILINAPAVGDSDSQHQPDISDAWERACRVMNSCGLHLAIEAPPVSTGPADFERLFPGGGGSLYGSASHGMMASFSRPASRSRIKDLYLAGGSVHPGPGVPMATLSGRLAAEAVIMDTPLLARVWQR